MIVFGKGRSKKGKFVLEINRNTAGFRIEAPGLLGSKEIRRRTTASKKGVRT